MFVQSRKLSLLLAVSALLVASLACNFPGSRNPVQAPAETVPVSTEAVQSLEQELQSAGETVQQNPDVPVTITVTEEQLTSLAVFELMKQPEQVLLKPQVFLRDGHILITGDVNQGNIQMPLEVTIAVSVDAAGQPDFQVTSAKVGPLPLPQKMIDELESQMDTIFDAQLRAQTQGMIIENITIGDGQMTVTGRTTQ